MAHEAPQALRMTTSATRHGYSVRCRRNGVPAVLLFIFTAIVCSSGFDITVTTSFDRNFTDKWVHASRASFPAPSVNDSTYPGMPLVLYVAFDGYSRNYFGIADLSFSYTVSRPGGGRWRDSSGISAFSGIIDEDAGAVLSGQVPTITFSRKDNPGTYTLAVTAEDRITGEKVTREKKIVLTGYPRPDPGRFDIVSFNVWVHHYCIAPDPARAVTAFSWFVNSASSNDDRIFWPVFYFFQALFKSNPVLVNELVRIIPGSSPRLREYAVFLFRAIEVQRRKEWPFTDSLWRSFDRVTQAGYLDPFAVALKSGSVQFLEMGFYCYGEYAMARFLMECCGLDTRQGYDLFLSHCGDYGVTCAGVLDTKTARRFSADARRILARAYPKHALLRAYCDSALAYDNLSPPAAMVLREITGARGW